MQKIRDMGGHNHMFAFFLERGSLMEDWEPVPPDQWRRVQLARFLIDYADWHVSRMRFDASGRLTDFGMDRDALEALVDSGKPFQTSGCPGHDNVISPRATVLMATPCRRISAHSRSRLVPVTWRWCAGRCGETMLGPTRSHKSAASLPIRVILDSYGTYLINYIIIN